MKVFFKVSCLALLLWGVNFVFAAFLKQYLLELVEGEDYSEVMYSALVLENYNFLLSVVACSTAILLIVFALIYKSKRIIIKLILAVVLAAVFFVANMFFFKFYF